MDRVRILTEKEELSQYARVCSYCFFDRIGWTERLLRPGVIEGSVYGCEGEGKIMSGVISFDLSFFYWGMNRISSSGIGCVASDPSVRNRGHIRSIMNRLLRDNYREGKILSFLYPFSYRYYGMFGYGTMGHAAQYRFDPSELTVHEAPEGGFDFFDRTERQYDEYLYVKNHWSSGFHGGVEETIGNSPRESFLEEMERDRRFLSFYRNEEGEARGFLLYKMEEGGTGQIISIIQSAWLDNHAFRGLIHYLWRHRSQVKSVLWTLPLSVPLEMLTREPRIPREDRQMWMGRPVNVPKALEMKSAYMPAAEPFAFSLKDPVIPENSGSYFLEGDAVRFREGDYSERELEFSVFSAMVMGGLSLEEGKAAGLVEEDFSADGTYLSRLKNICITRGF